MTNSHVHKICRTCLAYGTNLLPLDQNQAQNAFLGLGSNTNKSFGELLMHCTNIEVSFGNVQFAVVYYDGNYISFTSRSGLMMDCRKICACNAFVDFELPLPLRPCVKKVMSN